MFARRVAEDPSSCGLETIRILAGSWVVFKRGRMNDIELVIMALLIPMVQSQFAESLNDFSLKRLCIPYLLTCVRC
jgi:hypothetical protein